jgi:hypothetical protein
MKGIGTEKIAPKRVLAHLGAFLTIKPVPFHFSFICGEDKKSTFPTPLES